MSVVVSRRPTIPFDDVPAVTFRTERWNPSRTLKWNDCAVDQMDVQGNLRYLLNQWDPIGVADLVSDEYDCLIAPLLSKLSAGGGRSEISEFLWYELEDHFGLDPAGHDVDSMANRLVAWWAAVGTGPPAPA